MMSGAYEWLRKTPGIDVVAAHLAILAIFAMVIWLK